MEKETEPLRLYRFEYYEPLDNDYYVDWVWLKESEVSSYKSSINSVSARLATEEESDLYNEGYADGYGIAVVTEYESKNNGITYRVNLDDTGSDFTTTKMFECSMCRKNKEFDSDVATANNFYLTELKNDVLWHICFDCAMLQMEVEGIQIDSSEEGEASS